jgi:hypothetical protein
MIINCCLNARQTHKHFISVVQWSLEGPTERPPVCVIEEVLEAVRILPALHLHAELQ